MRRIETKRLYIRNFMKEDASSCLYGWGRDESLGDYIMGYPMNIDQMNFFDIPYQELRIGEIGHLQ